MAFISAQKGGGEETVLSLSEIDLLIKKSEYSAALKAISDCIQKNPGQFDQLQKRVSQIMKARKAFNGQAFELAENMRQSSEIQNLTETQSDAMDNEKLDMILSLEKMEQNPPAEQVEFTNDARRTIRLSYYINRSNSILAQGAALVEGGNLDSFENYLLAVEKNLEGLRLKTKDSDVVFEGEREVPVIYPEKLTESVEKQLIKIQDLSLRLKNQLDGCQKDYEKYRESVKSLLPEKAASDLNRLTVSFLALAQLRNEIYSAGKQLAELDRTALDLNQGLDSTSYITFSTRSVFGFGSLKNSGVISAIDSFYSSRIEDLKNAIFEAVCQEYSAITALFVLNQDFFSSPVETDRAFAFADGACEFAGQGEKIHGFYEKLEDSPDAGVEDYKKSLAFIEEFSRKNLKNLLALSKEVSEKNALLRRKSSEIQKAASFGTEILNSAGEYEKIGGELEKEKVSLSEFLTEDVLLVWNVPLNFYDELMSLAQRECSAQAGNVWSVFAKVCSDEGDRQLSDFSGRRQKAVLLLTGDKNADGEEKFQKYYPSLAWQQCSDLSADIKKEITVLSGYRSELSGGEKFRETQKVYADSVQNLETVIAEMEKLLEDCQKIMAEARQQSNEALKAANEARRQYALAEEEADKKNYDQARQFLSEADSSYKKSLRFEENDGLRREFSSKIESLDQSITEKQNSWVITSVRKLITEAYNSYYAGNFEGSRRTLDSALEIWEKTQAQENTEITQLSALVKEALESSGGTEISYADPLYKDMGTYLNNAKLHYEEGAKLYSNGKEEEGREVLLLARDEVRRVQRVFPKNQEAGNLNLLINKILEPQVFEDTVKQKINQAKASASSGKDVDLRNSLGEMRTLLKLIPENRAVAVAVKDFENRLNRLEESEQARKNIERSNALTVQAKNEKNLSKKIALLDEALALNRRNTQAQKLKDEAYMQNVRVTTVKNYLDDEDEVLYSRAERYYNDGLKEQAEVLIEELFTKNPQVAKVIKLKRRIENM